MNKICIFMPTTINVDINSYLYKNNQLEPNNKRHKQYYDGIKKIYELNKDKNIDIFISDNSSFLYNDSEIKNYINNTSIQIIKDVPNNYGGKNKGAGLIENWVFNKNFIKEYEWFIHFEPRQLLKSNQFIENFVKNPRNLFTKPTHLDAFNTGLFCIQTKIIMQYITCCNLNEMVSKRTSIEYALYKFFIYNKISFDILDKMDLLWFETTSLNPIDM
jgi:hypothetical protein